MNLDNIPVLYIFSGLPGTGKSTIAQGLSQAFSILYLRIDTIEQALRDLCDLDVQGEGYRLAYRIAADNLNQGMSVVADSCNPIVLTRQEWQQVATEAGAKYVNIEIICSDLTEHQNRIENRVSTINGLTLPTWEQVQNREYHAWRAERIVMDTANKTPDQCIKELVKTFVTI